MFADFQKEFNRAEAAEEHPHTLVNATNDLPDFIKAKIECLTLHITAFNVFYPTTEIIALSVRSRLNFTFKVTMLCFKPLILPFLVIGHGL